jgi:hypothetical protein
MNSASLWSLAGRYDNPIPTQCLAPIDFLKIPAPIYNQVNALKSLLRSQCWDIFAEHMLWYLVSRINAVLFVAKSMLRYSDYK